MKAVKIFKSFFKIFEKKVSTKSYILIPKEFSVKYKDYNICVNMSIGDRRRSELEFMLSNIYRYGDVNEEELLNNGWIKEDVFNIEKWSCKIDHDDRSVIFQDY